MRKTVFRTLAGILGAATVVLAIPVSKYSNDIFLPDWLHVLSFFIIGFVFLFYAATGRAWPRSYNDRIFKKRDDVNDR